MITGVSVSAGQRSDIQINPDTPEAQALRQWYDFEGRTASTQHAGEGLANARSATKPVLACRHQCATSCVMMLSSVYNAQVTCPETAAAGEELSRHAQL